MPFSNKNLFNEFNKTSRENWQSQILRDLKAATAEERKALYEQKMVWQTYEGIAIQPFYLLEDILNKRVSVPEKDQTSWQSRETIMYSIEKEANDLAIEAIYAGSQAIAFDLTNTEEVNTINFSKLLQQIKLSETPVSFLLNSLESNFITSLKSLFPYHWKGSLQYDPIALYLTEGKLNTREDFDVLADAITQTAAFPEFYALTIGSQHFHEAGASAVQELAFLIASFVEYADQLTERGLNIFEIFNTTQLSVSVSTNYFVEIAKCRALRILLGQLAQAYGIKEYKLYIHVQTASWNKSSSDAYNNIIRATIEAMAAVVGSCDSLTIAPFNATFAQTNAFTRRISRNISIILKEESYFDKVLNIASGAYYIEHLTYTLSQEAWRLFQTVESKGGIVHASQSGFINESIESVRLHKEADLKSGKQVLVGVNKYQVQNESIEQKEYFQKLYQNQDTED